MLKNYAAGANVKFLKMGIISLAASLVACGGCSNPIKEHPSSIKQPPVSTTVPAPITSSSTPVPILADASIDNICAHTGPVIVAQSVRVIDGDTVEVIPMKGKSERIRLLGIDAPEAKQDYGTQSTQALQQCVDDATVSIEWTERDRYDRLLGKVIADGKDCNLNQVVQGAAWHYKYYQEGQLAYDRLAYANAEVLARNQQSGLWANKNLTAPWDFRRGLSTKYAYNETTYDLTQAQCQLGEPMSEDHKKLAELDNPADLKQAI